MARPYDDGFLHQIGVGIGIIFVLFLRLLGSRRLPEDERTDEDRRSQQAH